MQASYIRSCGHTETLDVPTDDMEIYAKKEACIKRTRCKACVKALEAEQKQASQKRNEAKHKETLEAMRRHMEKELVKSGASIMSFSPPQAGIKIVDEGRDIAIEVLQNGVSYLRELLGERDLYWEKEATRLREENRRLSKSETRCKIAIAEMCQYIIHLEYAWANEQDFEISDADTYNRWWNLTGWEDKE